MPTTKIGWQLRSDIIGGPFSHIRCSIPAGGSECYPIGLAAGHMSHVNLCGAWLPEGSGSSCQPDFTLKISERPVGHWSLRKMGWRIGYDHSWREKSNNSKPYRVLADYEI
jgi:hypothetical protein